MSITISNSKRRGATMTMCIMGALVVFVVCSIKRTSLDYREPEFASGNGSFLLQQQQNDAEPTNAPLASASASGSDTKLRNIDRNDDGTVDNDYPVECQGKEHLVRILQTAGIEQFLNGDYVNPLPSIQKAKVEKSFNNNRRKQRHLQQQADEDEDDDEEMSLPSLCKSLPLWQDVVDVYGAEPRIYGLDTCEAYRTHLRTSSTHTNAPKQGAPRITSLFNCGSNAFSIALRNNLHTALSDVEVELAHLAFRVPWGKHIPPVHRLNNTILYEYADTNVDDENAKDSNDLPVGANVNDILPIILIRDPYMWMQSTCKHPYRAHFQDRRKNPCPTLLLPGQQEGEQPNTINVLHRTISEHHVSMAHWWSTFYGSFFHDTEQDENSTNNYPRLIIRYEDILFHAPAVMNAIADCAGLETQYDRRNDKYKYLIGTSKQHGSGSTMVSSLTKAGRSKEYRSDILSTSRDMDYARQHLNAKIMDFFHYPYV